MARLSVYTLEMQRLLVVVGINFHTPARGVKVGYSRHGGGSGWGGGRRVGGIIMVVTTSQCLLVVDNISTVDWSTID